MDYQKAIEILQIGKKNPSWIEISLFYKKRIFETHPDITKKNTELNFIEVYEAFQFLKQNYTRREAEFSSDNKKQSENTFRYEKISEEIINAVKKSIFEKYVNLEMDYFKSQDDLFAKYFENLNIYNTPLFVDGVFDNPNSLLEESVDLLKGSLFLDHEELHYEVGAYRSLNEVENKIIRNAHLNPDLLKKYILLTSQKRTAVGRIPLESINIKGLDLFIDFKGPEKFRRFGDKRSYSKQEIFGKEFSVEDILLNLRVGNPYEHHEGLTRLIETPLCNAGNWNQGLDPTTASELMGKISKAITAKDYEIELSTEIPENFPIMKFYEKTRDKKYADYQRRLWAGNYSMKYGFYINNLVIEDFPLIVDGEPTDIKKYFTSPKKLDK